MRKESKYITPKKKEVNETQRKTVREERRDKKLQVIQKTTKKNSQSFPVINYFQCK